MWRRFQLDWELISEGEESDTPEDSEIGEASG
jgi:hypothetical protein